MKKFFISILIVVFVSIFTFPYQEKMGEFFFSCNNNIYSFNLNSKEIKTIFNIDGYFLSNILYLNYGFISVKVPRNNSNIKEILFFNFKDKKIEKIKEFNCTNVYFNTNFLITIDYSKSINNSYRFEIFNLEFITKNKNFLNKNTSINFKIKKLNTLFIKEIINDIDLSDNFIFYSSNSIDSKFLELNIIELKTFKNIKIFSTTKNSNFLKINSFNYGNKNLVILNTSTANNLNLNNEIYLLDCDTLKEYLYKNIDLILNNEHRYKLKDTIINNKILCNLKILNLSYNLFSKTFFYNDKIFFQIIDNKNNCFLHSVNIEEILKFKEINFKNKKLDNLEISSIYSILKIEKNLIYYISYNYFKDKSNFYFVILDLSDLKEIFKYKL
ncbi:MAG: hypothetical protein N3A58_03650 [Spirochaetes bacterium]|nr:hypothetical protein [Spirochaetota bacterium]